MTVCLHDIGNCLSYADRCPTKAVHACEKIPEQQRLRKKRVTFSETVACVETEHVKDISPEDKAKRWLCGEDYFRTKVDLMDHLKIGEHFGWQSANGYYCCGERTFVNMNGDTATVTMRGIRSDLESRQRRHDQKETASVVLNEQLLQQSEGMTPTPEVIAMLYHLLSFSNQRQASERGLYDAACVYGSAQEYERLGGTKNVLYEQKQYTEVESMLVDEGILRHLMAKENCHPLVSVEDWLFERYQRGQRVAMAYYDSDNTDGDETMEEASA